MFGPVQEVRLHPMKAAGYLEFANAGQMVSIHRSVRSAAGSADAGKTTSGNVRSIWDLEFSDGFVDLHTQSYAYS